jgi:hypothetical protein
MHDYLNAAGHGEDENGTLFRPVRNNRTGQLERAITADGVYKLVRAYSAQLGFEIGAHALRATAATNTLEHEADIARCRNGSAMRTSPPCESTIAAARGRKTARLSRCRIDVEAIIRGLAMSADLVAQFARAGQQIIAAPISGIAHELNRQLNQVLG